MHDPNLHIRGVFLVTTTVVIGGGITGLSTLYYLQKEMNEKNLDMQLVLVEGDDTLGGKIRTFSDGEFTMETGADSIVARKSNVAPFLEELGLSDQVVYNATGISYIYNEDGLNKIPADAVFGIPIGLESLVQSELISAEGKVEALKDFYTTNETFTMNDSLGLFLETFLGKELVQKQIAPVVSGVYSGELNDLTIASTFPFLLEYKNKYGSIIKGLSENKHIYLGAANKKFISFKNGMSVLIDRMEELLADAQIYKGIKAESVEKMDKRYIVTLADGRKIEADYVVFSNSSLQAQELLQDNQLAEDFSQLHTKSMISIYLGFDVPDSQLPSDGTGFISVKESDVLCDACTWTSRKWEHTSKGRRLLLRLFYKSSNPEYARLVRLSEEELKSVALQDIAKSLGLTAEPVTAEVTKWHENMPNYHLKHREIVDSLELKLEQGYPNVLLAGCSYYGVGIPDCIANGERTAHVIVDRLLQK
ncbi:oxygen-dependent protoporphyrinogen oxidase [Paenibacillus uliginis N3/975]|uniref:Coproporphyrinogen III oxidase n=1 Tax=Paenibacillus uliginis N3/975 TaxID=1313296 RepID=A0A1X7HBJ9_9BACL|nr:oxygen-dependent protoporphyrinogen oxidase [Paenibacillus uliginis N3/975]